MTRLHGDLVHRRTLVSLAARVRGSAVPVRSCPRAGICVRPTRACPSSTHRATLSAMPGIRSRRVINRIVSYRYQQKDAHHGMFHRAASGPPFTISDEPNCSSAPWPGGSLAASAAIPNGRLMSTALVGTELYVHRLLGPQQEMLTNFFFRRTKVRLKKKVRLQKKWQRERYTRMHT